ncbi:hypothetical protein AAG906_018341 [Vitis piasezkii]
MEEAKVMKTPMSSSIKLDMDEKGKSIDSTMYRGMIGSLLYLTASRPDIMYSGDNFELIGFSDADFAGCRVERKSTSGTCHFLGHSLVSWHNQFGLFLGPILGFGVIFDEILRLGFHLWIDLDLDLDGFLSALRHLRFCSFPRLGLIRSLLSLPRLCSWSLSPFMDFGWLLEGDGMTYGLGGPIRTTVRGVEIELSPESICRILDIPPIERLFEVRSCDAYGMGKPSAHSLTVPSRVLHHMICSILLPRGGHRDEVSYYEAFLVDSLLTGRRIHVGYVMMRHMMSCCESTTRVLPYGRFLTPRGPELDILPPHRSRAFMLRLPSRAYDDREPSFTIGPSSRPSFTELPSHAPHAPDHPPWMDLSFMILAFIPWRTASIDRPLHLSI